MRQIVLDTETTGLEPEQGHRIIEIGCVELVNRRLTGRHFHQYVRPDRQIDAAAFAVHGISEQALEDKPPFSEVAEGFLAFIEGAELIIHNAPFDVGFINHELGRLDEGQPLLEHYCRVLDTLALARELHPGQRNSLDALCKRYAIDASKRDVHGALIDSELLANVYLAMTGGQSSLLLDGEAPGGNGATTTQGAGMTGTLVADAVVDLPVIRANADELAAHEAMLEKIRESGACVWDID